MLEDSRDKLNEARFFSKKLHELPDPFRPVPDTFRYHFSAFLYAARSVWYYVQREVIAELRARPADKRLRAADQYKKWWNAWPGSLSPDQRSLWSNLMERDGIAGREVHRKRTKTTAKQKMIPGDRFPSFQCMSEQSRAYQAYYNVPQVYRFTPLPLMSDAVRTQLSLAPGSDSSVTVPDWHIKIEGTEYAVTKFCDDTIELLESLVCHFEQFLT
jgi:hypothetical protein